jgi:hypothetical protein
VRITSAIGVALRRVSPRAAKAAKKAWALRRHTPWNKAHIINHLATSRGHRHYLELCTPITGGRYAEIDHAKFETCLRLMYNCPEAYVPCDGLLIDYRATGLDISECLTKMREDGRRVDIALIDSFHDYEPSMRDLIEGFRLLDAGGTLVVHDCLPPRAEIAQPKLTPGEWCGVSYQAFVDFVINRDDVEFYTVDTDYGCGIIHKQPRPPSSIIDPRTKERERTFANWLIKRDDPWAAFSFFETHKRMLTNLVSIREFLAKNTKSIRRQDNPA